MTKQLNLMDLFDGKTLAKAGLELALESAEKKDSGWQSKCWLLFLDWLRYKPQGYLFMIEDFRRFAEGRIVPPPSNRAFAFLAKRGQKENLICFNRIKKVNNRLAHSANANEYRVIG